MQIYAVLIQPSGNKPKGGDFVPTTVTPIRYPGGKTKLYSFVRDLLQKNNLLHGTYCEPFAGGAGLAIKLLEKKDVNHLVLNDADPAIYAVWDLILHSPDELCDFIQNVDISIEEWDRQKQVYSERDNYSLSELGKATIFLNRTNVSGVITGGVIGGREQKGNYKIDARFNKESLIKKIRTIAALQDHIDLYNLDALEMMDQVFPDLEDRTLVNFDPPYVKKGKQLYKNSFTTEDHTRLKNRIAECNKSWIVTYDVCDLVKELYTDFRGGFIDVYYSANEIRKAQEYVFYSDNLVI